MTALTATGDALAFLRGSTLFLVSTATPPTLHCVQELLADLPAAAADEPSAEPADNEQHPAKRGITASAFFQAGAAAHIYALLLLVDERRLVHYEVDTTAKTVVLSSHRSVPRNSTCMTVASLGEHRVVIVGEKTGEVVAMPFPDLDRDLKSLLGHTTSMVTAMATAAEGSLLLTADRDEKVRVSQFPRTSLVQSYCLGHKAALTAVASSVMTPDLAVSTSLDNTIKLWRLSTGEELDSSALLAADADASALRHTAIAISATHNVVAVVVRGSLLRFFAIEAVGASFRLVPKELAAPIATHVSAHDPTDVEFLARDGALAIAYRQSPFLRIFAVKNVTATNIVLAEQSASEALNQVRKDAAKIALPKDDENATADEMDGPLQKKKVKLNDWKSKSAEASSS
ncbi:hypothetical protein P43SY_007305 [Pythium insidiosum]|uniref:WD repeat-containing protein 4 homolog n=1 Tax=Pythium insidiosum TaxID=114742 RepID=A0AAD5Q9T6_PYTIN|nr:hypothetical protein P43SY_007305 [Pythium insidiosum]